MFDCRRLVSVEALDAARSQDGPESLVNATDLASELRFSGRKAPARR